MRSPSDGRSPSNRLGIVAAALSAAFGIGLLFSGGRAEEARVVPPPVADLSTSGEEQTIVLAGGCFWGVQGVFQHTAGVTSAVSGYAGGEAGTAHYDQVTSGSTGHAEAVRVTYDPRRISYGRVLQIYFSVVHDPTQIDRQGPDRGTQYRSAIFPKTAEQIGVAGSYIAQLNQAKAFKAPIATKIEPDRAFYPAEAYHQDYLTRHPDQPYIAIHDLPKIDALRRLFPDLYTAKPVLVAATQ